MKNSNNIIVVFVLGRDSDVVTLDQRAEGIKISTYARQHGWKFYHADLLSKPGSSIVSHDIQAILVNKLARLASKAVKSTSVVFVVYGGAAVDISTIRANYVVDVRGGKKMKTSVPVYKKVDQLLEAL